MSPYWQVADIYLVATGDGVEVFCNKCDRPISTPGDPLSLKEAKRVARKHKHRK